jgi:transposase
MEIFMRPQKTFPDNATEHLEELLASSNSDAELSRIKSVYLRAKYGYDAERIAKITGLKLQTVRNIHSAYIKKGEAALKLSGKGGRKNFHLDLKIEAAFLANFKNEGKSDSVEVKRIHAAYQDRVGRKTALSTTYRLLRRHGWRKYYPHPGHWYIPQENTS